MESAELIAILKEVRERVRARYPENTGGPSAVPLPDLEPLVRARDAALAKVAAIGSVNPRPGGPANTLVQTWKRLVARVLDWHVREQIVFNTRTMAALDVAIETFAESNRALAAIAAAAASENAELAARLASLEKLVADQISATAETMEQTAQEFGDMRKHWAEWRAGWEQKLAQNEIQFLRSVADLQAAYTHRADLMDANYRDTLRGQHADFSAALERNNAEIQRRLWADLEKVKLDYERLIYTELRLIRQRAANAGAGGSACPPPPRQAEPPAPPLDYSRFAERFRGDEEHIKAGQRLYVPHFAACREVLDIGCGRGEFLELMREAGIPARGIDLGEESVAVCREKGLQAETADLFAYLASLPDSSLDGIFCAQVVEHLPPERLPEMIKLCASRLTRTGVIAVETPNPECLAIFATHFYLDPTHIRPVPHPLLAFYFQEYGIGVVELRKLSPAVDAMPTLASLPEDFREAFFGGLDYGIVGRKL